LEFLSPLLTVQHHLNSYYMELSTRQKTWNQRYLISSGKFAESVNNIKDLHSQFILSQGEKQLLETEISELNYDPGRKELIHHNFMALFDELSEFLGKTDTAPTESKDIELCQREVRATSKKHVEECISQVQKVIAVQEKIEMISELLLVFHSEDYDMIRDDVQRELREKMEVASYVKKSTEALAICIENGFSGKIDSVSTAIWLNKVRQDLQDLKERLDLAMDKLSSYQQTINPLSSEGRTSVYKDHPRQKIMNRWYDSFNNTLKKDPSFNSERGETQMNIFVEGNPDPIGYILVNEVITVAQAREIIDEEVDDVPTPFVFLSYGFEVKKAQEAKSKALYLAQTNKDLFIIRPVHDHA